MSKTRFAFRKIGFILLCLLLLVSQACAESGTDVFRTADRVYDYQNGWVLFINDHSFGFVNPLGEILTGGWDNASNFNPETGVAIVYKGKVGRFHSPEGNGAGFYGLINTRGEEVLPVEYRSISSTDEGIVPLVTADGDFCIYHLDTGEFFRPEDPAITYMGGRCSNGLIAVYTGGLNENGSPVNADPDGKWGYIDKEGKTVIPFRFDLASQVFVDGLAMVKTEGHYGAIDSSGNFAIPPTWDKLNLNEGAIIGTKDDASYILDKTGTIRNTLPAGDYQYDGNGFFIVFNLTEPNSTSLIDADGNEIIPAEWGTIARANDHLAVVSKKDGKKSKSGVLDYRKGELVLPLIYDTIEPMSGQAVRYFCQLGYYGFMDEEFNTIISPSFLEVTSMSDGYAAVRTEDGWHMIDLTGTILF
jgi:hypothetical protein